MPVLNFQILMMRICPTRLTVFVLYRILRQCSQNRSFIIVILFTILFTCNEKAQTSWVAYLKCICGVHGHLCRVDWGNEGCRSSTLPAKAAPDSSFTSQEQFWSARLYRSNFEVQTSNWRCKENGVVGSVLFCTSRKGLREAVGSPWTDQWSSFFEVLRAILFFQWLGKIKDTVVMGSALSKAICYSRFLFQVLGQLYNLLYFPLLKLK